MPKYTYQQFITHPNLFIDRKARSEKPAGYCWNLVHRGYLTPQLIRQHGCKSRNCQFLQKYTQHIMWHKKEYKNWRNSA